MIRAHIAIYLNDIQSCMCVISMEDKEIDSFKEQVDELCHYCCVIGWIFFLMDFCFFVMLKK